MDTDSRFDKIVLFHNPNAGSDASITSERLAAHGLSPAETITSLEALTTFAWRANDLLLVAGGDGTVNEVVRRVLGRDPVLGILPTGTGNDFARSLGLPLDPDAACAALAGATLRRVDVAEINDQVLLNAAHIGLGAIISGRDARNLKGQWGRLSYLRALLARLGTDGAFKATIRLAEGQLPASEHTHHWRSITIANGRFFGGGHTIGPEASLDDGLLDVLAVRDRSFWILLFAEIRRRLGLTAHPALRHWRVASVTIEANAAHPVTVDGDVRTQTPVTARVQAKALRVLVPSDTAPGIESKGTQK